jgi:hypothetical protein
MWQVDVVCSDPDCGEEPSRYLFPAWFLLSRLAAGIGSTSEGRLEHSLAEVSQRLTATEVFLNRDKCSDPPRRPGLLRARRGPLARRRPDRFVTHLAMQEADDNGSPVTWGEQVTDDEYGAARPRRKGGRDVYHHPWSGPNHANRQNEKYISTEPGEPPSDTWLYGPSQ